MLRIVTKVLGSLERINLEINVNIYIHVGFLGTHGGDTTDSVGDDHETPDT